MVLCEICNREVEKNQTTLEDFCVKNLDYFEQASITICRKCFNAPMGKIHSILYSQNLVKSPV